MAISYKKRNKPTKNTKRYLVNNRIRMPELRVILDDGENLGVISTKEALKKALEMEKDLVVISEKASPPVAKILEFSKFLYDEKKKQSSSKSKSSKSETKEFVFGPSIGDGDLEKRIERTKEFINDGNKVKYTIRLRGRQRAHPQIGIEKLKRVQESLADIARTEEGQPTLKGSLITLTLVKK